MFKNSKNANLISSISPRSPSTPQLHLFPHFSPKVPEGQVRSQCSPHHPGAHLHSPVAELHVAPFWQEQVPVH